MDSFAPTDSVDDSYEPFSLSESSFSGVDAEIEGELGKLLIAWSTAPRFGLAPPGAHSVATTQLSEFITEEITVSKLAIVSFRNVLYSPNFSFTVRYLQKLVQRILSASSDASEGEAVASPKRPAEATAITKPAKKGKKVAKKPPTGCDMSAERSAAIAKPTVAEQLDALLAIESVVPHEAKKRSMNTWLCRVLHPVLRCYRDHYCGNSERFVASTTKLTYRKEGWKCNCGAQH